MHRHDVLILGSGLAALTTALKLADQRRVAIVTKREMTDGASDWLTSSPVSSTAGLDGLTLSGDGRAAAGRNEASCSRGRKYSNGSGCR